ncbi:hypothetical protein VNO77_33543 [Canavalia gladiata]|uniref:Uncharacterized protein n=1 Tax=Canavalia gladiata TaxID=3824 RepID=A0AAN9KEJ8_CANGL
MRKLPSWFGLGIRQILKAKALNSHQDSVRMSLLDLNLWCGALTIQISYEEKALIALMVKYSSSPFDCLVLFPTLVVFAGGSDV